MDDDIFDESASELSIIEKDWMRSKESHVKASFASGSTDGYDFTINEGFNNGFKHGFFSSFLLSKVQGILKAVMAYRASYEGHPITDDVLIDAQQLLDDLSQLETDSIVDDFISMTLDSSHLKTNSVCDEMISDLSINIDKGSNNVDLHNAGNSNESSLNNFSSPSSSDIDISNKQQEMQTDWTLSDVNRILISCPEVADIIKRCKCILKRLKWTDTMIDALF